MHALGLKSSAEYQAWCRKRGLSSGLYKSDSQKIGAGHHRHPPGSVLRKRRVLVDRRAVLRQKPHARSRACGTHRRLYPPPEIRAAAGRFTRRRSGRTAPRSAQFLHEEPQHSQTPARRRGMARRTGSTGSGTGRGGRICPERQEEASQNRHVGAFVHRRVPLQRGESPHRRALDPTCCRRARSVGAGWKGGRARCWRNRRGRCCSG